MTLDDFIKKEIKLLNSLKKVLEKEVNCIKEREYKSYKQLVKRKGELANSLVELQKQRQMFCPNMRLQGFVLEDEHALELIVEYQELAREVQNLNESIELLTTMEQVFASAFIETVEKAAFGEQTYGMNGEYESPNEVDSTIINRRF